MTRKNTYRLTPNNSSAVRVIRLTHKNMIAKYQPALLELLTPYAPILHDDFSDPAGLGAQALLETVKTSIPYVWLCLPEGESKTAHRAGVAPALQILAAAYLSDETPDWRAELHGVSDQSLKKNPLLAHAISTLNTQVLAFAFEALNIQKLIAAFDADNPGALGYCLRNGFTFEARLKAETRRHGQPVDTLRYALFKPEYLARVQAKEAAPVELEASI
ncbi:MAG: GNAT family protein [Vampirovibrionales bacterium]|nr:GNAT family protein [Vampirovibrionales bacterium]